MNANSTSHRSALAAAAVLLVIGFTPLPAHAAQDPRAMSPAYTESDPCPIVRLGLQLIRCDNLSGNGVAAHLGVPER